MPRPRIPLSPEPVAPHASPLEIVLVIEPIPGPIHFRHIRGGSTEKRVDELLKRVPQCADAVLDGDRPGADDHSFDHAVALQPTQCRGQGLLRRGPSQSLPSTRSHSSRCSPAIWERPDRARVVSSMRRPPLTETRARWALHRSDGGRPRIVRSGPLKGGAPNRKGRPGCGVPRPGDSRDPVTRTGRTPSRRKDPTRTAKVRGSDVAPVLHRLHPPFARRAGGGGEQRRHDDQDQDHDHRRAEPELFT